MPEVSLPDSNKPLLAMYDDKVSLLGELGLFEWWKPTGYLRWALESLHLHAGLEWWVAIACTTAALRLATIWVPVMSHRLQAKVSQHSSELKQFRERTDEANKAGDQKKSESTLTWLKGQ